jgi:hypothetical protein
MSSRGSRSGLRFVSPIILAATLQAVCAMGVVAKPHGHGSSMAAHPAVMLREDMRRLWSDHVIWTRDYIIAAAGDYPDAQAAANRLLKNQEDLGNAVAVYYGKAAGDKLTGLLKEHITIAVDLIKAAKAKDDAAFKEQDRKWHANAEDIAEFLSKANPNWPKSALSDMMKTHLSTTTDEVVARLNQKWDDDVKAFDEVYSHILKMSDALSEGIIKQFPDKFGRESRTAGHSPMSWINPTSAVRGPRAQPR